MFASGSEKKAESGSVLLLVVVVLAVAGVYAGVEFSRFKAFLISQQSLDLARTRAAWGRAIADRIDCPRVMAPYTKSHVCPVDSPRILTFVADPPLQATGPEQSFPVGKDWYAKVTCGTTDLNVQIAHYVNGKYDIDRVAGKSLDFAHPTARMSDGGQGIAICEGYFANGIPAVRILGMSIATHQKDVTYYGGSDNTVQWLPQRCDGAAGMIADMNKVPVPEIYRAGGVNGPLNAGRASFSEYVYTEWRRAFDAWGLPAAMKEDWVMWGSAARLTNSTTCTVSCNKRGYRSGLATKCDKNVVDTTSGQTIWDDTSTQVNCLCLK